MPNKFFTYYNLLYFETMGKKESHPENDEISDLVKFLLKDTISLRNEIHFIKSPSELVHPLSYSENSKKYPNLVLIPNLEKINENIKGLFLKTYI